MNIKAYRTIAEAEAESYRDIFKAAERSDLEEMAVRLSADSSYWKSLYMRASNNTPPAQLK